MELETIIGLEVHAQLSTKTKLWCGCDNDAFQKEPNTCVCPICMGFPGTLPTLNKEAVKKAVFAGKSIGCTINAQTKFDRKNYFYPDLPTGYQISQYDIPIAEKGSIPIHTQNGKRLIGVTRIHLENDAGKLTHTTQGTLCDYNRCGTPLIEIVTEPEIRSAEEAQSFAKELQKLLRYIGVSDADMEKGMMRFDASISLRPKGEKKLYPRTEIKNLNSFTSLKKALQYEEERQKKAWELGNPSSYETTVGWIEEENKTQLMRKKESADDYRYFPEPDIPPLDLDTIPNLLSQEESFETPFEKYERYRNEYQLNENDALKLTETKTLSVFYETAVTLSGDAKRSAGFLLSEILRDSQWYKTPITPQHIADVIQLVDTGKLSNSGAKRILQEALRIDKNAEQLMQALKLEQNSNQNQLEEWIQEVLQENPQSIEDYNDGKTKALQYLMGQVMKKSKGSANPPLIQEILYQKIKSE